MTRKKKESIGLKGKRTYRILTCEKKGDTLNHQKGKRKKTSSNGGGNVRVFSTTKNKG